MDPIIWAAPLLPGRSEAWRRFCQELMGSQRAQYVNSRRRLGIGHEEAWLVPRVAAVHAMNKSSFFQSQEVNLMTLEENKAIVRRFWSYDPDLQIAEELLAAEFVNHDPAPGSTGDKADLLQRLAGYYRAFPDHTITVDDIIAQGDRVVTRWTVHGTHRGELMGIPPTGNEIQVSGITINRVRDGQIVEQWQCENMLGLMQQLGVVPAPEHAAG